ncbi:MAG: methylmalonyl-CoA mutase, partial [Flavobacterium sp.]
MRKNIQNLNLNGIQNSKVENSDLKEELFLTAEKISLKKIYTKSDLDNLDHINFVAGIAPNLRGPYSTMFVRRPWTIRQYAGFSTAEESNAFYR